MFILKHGVDANARDANNVTPLHLALHPDVARLLLQYGSDIYARHDKGTQFIRTTVAKNYSINELLSEYGAKDYRM
jgi:tankyrase